MENLPEKRKLPTVAELFEDNLAVAYKNEQLNILLNADPKKEWIKEHPYISGYKYIPIDKIEFMLRKIFKQYSIEILREGTSFNGVYVVVRVHYYNPASDKMEFHDGIGAVQLQTKKGTSPSDLININNGAISMAYPIAKTIAIKDACDHFGRVFGCDLNRKDTIPFSKDTELIEKSVEQTRFEKLVNGCKNIEELSNFFSDTMPDWQTEVYEQKYNELCK